MPSSREKVKDAAQALENAILENSLEIRVPEGVGLQHKGRINDVEKTAQKVVGAIQGFMKVRSQSKTLENKVIAFVQKWFMATYRYVGPSLSVVEVERPEVMTSLILGRGSEPI